MDASFSFLPAFPLLSFPFYEFAVTISHLGFSGIPFSHILSVCDLGFASWFQKCSPSGDMSRCQSLQLDQPVGAGPVFLFIFIILNAPSMVACIKGGGRRNRQKLL